MTKGDLAPRNGSAIKVGFDLRYDESTKQRPVPGIPVGKSDFQLKIKAASGTPIPSGDYDLNPEGSKIVFGVSNSGGQWSLKTVTL